MAIEVELPDGSIAEFPDGTSPDVIQSALRRRFNMGGAPAQPAAPAVASARKAVSGGADASALAAAPTGEYDPRTSGADPLTGALSRLMGNPASALPMFGFALSQRLAGKPVERVEEATRRQGANVLSMLSNDEGDQALAAQATGAKVIDHPTYGKVAVLPDGSMQQINAPGLTPRSVERAAAQIAPFAVGPGGAGTGLASRFGMGALRGLVGGGVREGIEAPARAAAGGEQNLGQTAADLALDTVTGGVGEAVLGPLMRLGASAIQRLRGVDKWSRESVAAALSKEGLPPETIDAVWRAGRQGQDPQQILRLVEAQQINAPLARGQITGDEGQMAQFRALLAQSGDQNPGSAMARGALEGQDAALAAEAQRIRDAAGVDPTRVGPSAGSDVLAPLEARAASEQARTTAAYAKVPEDAVLNPRVFTSREFSVDGRSVTDSIGDILRAHRGGSTATTGQLRNLLDALNSGKPIPWQQWDNIRRNVSELTTAEAGEGAAARKSLDLMNRMEEWASQQGAFSSFSDPAANVGPLIRDARRAAKTGMELFRGKVDTPTGGETADAVNRLLSGGVQPQQVMDDLLGAGGKLDPKRRGFSEGLAKLAQVSPQSFVPVRLEAINRAVEQVMTAQSDKALEKALRGLRENKPFLGSLIDEKQFDEIFRLARVRRAALAGRSGTKAPLPNKDFLQKVSTAVMMTGLTAAGGGAMLGAGPVFGLALAGGGALGRAAARRSQANLARNLAGPVTAQQLPGAVPRADARLVPGILDFLQGEDQ